MLDALVVGALLRVDREDEPVGREHADELDRIAERGGDLLQGAADGADDLGPDRVAGRLGLLVASAEDAEGCPCHDRSPVRRQ